MLLFAKSAHLSPSQRIMIYPVSDVPLADFEKSIAEIKIKLSKCIVR